MRGKRIAALLLAAVMAFGDAAPLYAAQPLGGAVSEQTASQKPLSEETSQTEEGEKPEAADDAAPPAAEEPSAPGAIPGQEEADPVDPDFGPAEAELPEEMQTEPAESSGETGGEETVVSVDVSEYVLQAGGLGLPTDSEDGIALFAAVRPEDVILAGLKSREAEIDLTGCGVMKGEVSAVFSRVLNDNPSLFYVENHFQYSSFIGSNEVLSITPFYSDEYDESAYEAAVEKALESINDEMAPVEKALALHDYLVLYCAYENDGKGNYTKYNAYNALVEGVAVCQGYALAYMELCRRAGIPCVFVSSQKLNHAWNMVELDGKWYQVDATWDDPIADLEGLVSHKYFLKSDGQFGHIPDDRQKDWVIAAPGQAATDTSYDSGRFWNDLNAAVIFEGSACYYMKHKAASYQPATLSVAERSHEGGEREVYTLPNDTWPVWGGGGYYTQPYSGLSRSGDYLYCNDKNSVYRIYLPSVQAEKVYTYTGTDGYLYGSCIQGDTLRLSVAQIPHIEPKRLKVTMQHPQKPAVEASLAGVAESRRYSSLKEAAANLARDFDSKAGTYRFTLLSDSAPLTQDVTLPSFVQELELCSAQTEQARLFARLDFQGFTLSAAAVKLQEGVWLTSTKGKGILKLTGISSGALFAESPVLRTEALPGNTTWVNEKGNPLTATGSLTLANRVDIQAPQGVVAFHGGSDGRIFRLAESNVTAQGLRVEAGEWEFPGTASVSGTYQVSQGASAQMTALTLTNAQAQINGACSGSVQMSGSRLTVGGTGRLSANLTVTAAYGQESAANGWTVENRGSMTGTKLQMPTGTFYNAGAARFDTVDGVKALDNRGLFMGQTFTQAAGSRICLRQGSILAVKKGTFYNAELGGGHFYRIQGASEYTPILKGSVSLAADLPAGTPGLTCAVIAPAAYSSWWESGKTDAVGLTVEPLAPPFELFTTDVANVPTGSIRALQPQGRYAGYTKVARAGNSILVEAGQVTVERTDASPSPKKRYESLDEAALYLAEDFQSKPGRYRFTLGSDAELKKDLAFPDFVTELELCSEQKAAGRLFVRLDFRGFTLSAASVTLQEGVRLVSTGGKRGALSVKQDLNMNALPAVVTWLDSGGQKLTLTQDTDSRTLADGVDIRALRDVRLSGRKGGGVFAIRNSSLTAGGLYVSAGDWSLAEAAVTNQCIISQEAGAQMTALTLTNAQAQIDGACSLIGGGSVQMTGSALTIGSKGRLTGNLVVKSAGSQPDGYTVKNSGFLDGEKLQMQGGTFLNEGKVRVGTVDGLSRLENKGHWISRSFTQKAGSASHLSKNATLAVERTAVLYNVSFYGAYLYQARGCVAALNGTTAYQEPTSAEGHDGRRPLTCAVVSAAQFEELWAKWPDAQNDYSAIPVEGAAPGARLFTTDGESFPADSVCVRQNQRYAGYTTLCKSESNIEIDKGSVRIEVARAGQQGSQLYQSLDDVLLNLAADFGSQPGEYRFTLWSDAELTKSLTLPAFIQKLELGALSAGNGPKAVRLDFKGFTLSASASVTLEEGVLLTSTGKKGTLKLTGAPADGAVFYIKAQEQTKASGDSGVEAQLLADHVDVSAVGGRAALSGGSACRLNDFNLTAKGLSVESGAWQILGAVSLSGAYELSQGASAQMTALTLTNAQARIDGACSLTGGGSVQMSGSRLAIGKQGSLNANLTVTAAYGQESAANDWTVENHGSIVGGTLKMPAGTFYNVGAARFDEVQSLKTLSNEGLFLSSIFLQDAGSSIRLHKDSVLTVEEKAVLYNATLGGARLYQAKGCAAALEGTVTRAEGLSEKTPGLTFAVISKEQFQAWKNGTQTDDTAITQVEGMPYAYRLFTTKIARFPVDDICVRQDQTFQNYTKIYQEGQEVRVGGDTIVIFASSIDGTEQELKRFVRWADAVNYLSGLSNPNMTYIVQILGDLDIGAMAMPTSAAGLVFRAGSQEGAYALSYDGDLNLTMPLEFSKIELKAKKGGAPYESVVRLNGMSLTFSNGSKGVFASISGSASSSLALNGGSAIEAHGAVNVGRLQSVGGGALSVPADLRRDKEGAVTSVTPSLTVNGETLVTGGKITVTLTEKMVENRVASWRLIDFSGESTAAIRTKGVRLAKAACADPTDFCLAGTPDNSPQSAMSKQDGYVAYYGSFTPVATLSYDSGGTKIPFESFGDAVAEINRLRTKREYTICFGGSVGAQAPAALVMPGRGMVSKLRLEAAPDSGGRASLHYLGNLTLTSDTVLKDVDFVQMVKSGTGYVSVAQQNAFPSPVSFSAGGFLLSIEGTVSFDTPLNLDGGGTGTLALAENAALITNANPMQRGSAASPKGSVIAGTVRRFLEIQVPSGGMKLVRYETGAPGKVSYRDAELNVTGIKAEGPVQVEDGSLTVASLTAKKEVLVKNGSLTATDLTAAGNVRVENGNLTVRGNLVFGNGTLAASGDKAGKISLANVTLEGNSELFADRDFTVTGKLSVTAGSATLVTRRKAPVRNAEQAPYLNLGGTVETGTGRITVRVLPNDCGNNTAVTLSGAPDASGQLLTARTAGAECFQADAANLPGSDPADKSKSLYGPDNKNGYILAKVGSALYVHPSQKVAVALCTGDQSDGNWESKDVLGYYTGWQEAVTALNGRGAADAVYTLLLLQDLGTKNAPLRMALPFKASKVYVAGASEGEKKKIFCQNDLTLGADTEFVNLDLNLATARGGAASLGMNAGNFDLTLQDVKVGSGSLKNITGSRNGTVTVKISAAYGPLRLAGSISGLQSVTVQKGSTKEGLPDQASPDFEVEGGVTVVELALAGGVAVEAKGAVTVGSVENDGSNTLIYGRTAGNRSNLTINGEIENKKFQSPLRLRMKLPTGKSEDDYALALEDLKGNAGSKKVTLNDDKKLATMPKAFTSDFVFDLSEDQEDQEGLAVVKANKGLYLAGEGVEDEAVELDVERGQDENASVWCLDLTQAVNEINTLADAGARYEIKLGKDYTDTNLTDNSPYGPLPMPISGRAKGFTLTGNTGTEPHPCLTFYGNITMSGDLTLDKLTLEPVRGGSDRTGADFSITVTAKPGDTGCLELDTVSTLSDQNNWDWEKRSMKAGEADKGFISQISGTRNGTDVEIRSSDLRLKGGIANIRDLTLESAHLITCGASGINDLRVTLSSWDALGVTAIQNITAFQGPGSYLAGKQDNRKLPQLTINGKADVSAVCRVITDGSAPDKITHEASYKDKALLKAAKEAAGRFQADWRVAFPNASDEAVKAEAAKWISYKDLAGYVLCGDPEEMPVRLTAAKDNQKAQTYAKSYYDAVTIINNQNEPDVSYTLELLTAGTILTGRDGAFGRMDFPANGKAESFTVKGTLDGTGKPKSTLEFNGASLSAYGKVTLEQVALHSVKSQQKSVVAPFDISVGGTAQGSFLKLDQVTVDGNALKNINGDRRACVILSSISLVIAGSVNNVAYLQMWENASVQGSVRADALEIQRGVSCKVKEAVSVATLELGTIRSVEATRSGDAVLDADGTVTITKIENYQQGILRYGRTAGNRSNLTVNGTIENRAPETPLRLQMKLPSGKRENDYKLALEDLKGAAGGKKVTLNDDKKLATMPKAFTSDFALCFGENGSALKVVKANKGVYLAGDDVAGKALDLEMLKPTPADATERPGVIRCLDLTQAVNEINTLAYADAEYRIAFSEDCADTNLTDGSPYGPLPMPISGRAGAFTLAGAKKGARDLDSLPRLTFSGNITMSGSLALERLILNPVNGNSPADFSISVTAKPGEKSASLTLDEAYTAADYESRDWYAQAMQTGRADKGFISQISGTRNGTDVALSGSKLRLKNGIRNIGNLSLDKASLITCGSSEVNELSVNESSWDALGATAIQDITVFQGQGSYLAGKQDGRKLPQLTVNGEAKETVICKVITVGSAPDRITYETSYKDTALLKAVKEAAERFQADWSKASSGASGWIEAGRRISYKDAAGYVLCGDQAEMPVRLGAVGSGRKTYAKSYYEAVAIINNQNNPTADYELEFLRVGRAFTGIKGTAPAALTLPVRARSVAIRGVRDAQKSADEATNTVLCYTGTLSSACSVTFKDIVLTEGTASRNAFTPTWQITLSSGSGTVDFQNVATLKSPTAKPEEEEAKADLVIASATARGEVILRDEKAYVKGNFTVPSLAVEGSVALIADKAVTLTNIRKEGTQNASLALDTKHTAIARAGQQSVTQLTLNGKIDGVRVGIAPQMYDLLENKHHRLTPYEARALLAGEKPNLGQKLANVAKDFNSENITLLYDYENTWTEVTPIKFDVCRSELYSSKELSIN